MNRAYVLPLLCFVIVLTMVPFMRALDESGWRRRLEMHLERSERKALSVFKECLRSSEASTDLTCALCPRQQHMRLCTRKGAESLSAGLALSEYPNRRVLIDWKKFMEGCVEAQPELRTINQASIVRGDLEADLISVNTQKLVVSGTLQVDTLESHAPAVLVVAGADIVLGSLRAPVPSKVFLFSVRGSVRVLKKDASVELYASAWDSLRIPKATAANVTMPVPLLRETVYGMQLP